MPNSTTWPIIDIFNAAYEEVRKVLRFQRTAVRTTPVLHRDAVIAADKVTAPAAPALADVGVGGGLAFNTTYNVSLAVSNRWGPTTCSTPAAQLTANDAANTHIVRVTPAAMPAGGDCFEVFLSTDAGPKWVGRVTAAQVTAGCVINPVGTVTSPGGVAGSIDIACVGTGRQTTDAVFAKNNAFKLSGITAIDCTGETKLHFDLKLALTGFLTAPSVDVIPFFQNQASAGDWHAGLLQTVSFLNGAGTPLEQTLDLDTEGHPAVVLLVASIAGDGAALSVWQSKS